MKKTISLHFKTMFILAIMALVVVSCQKDDAEGSTSKESSEQKSNFSVTRINESKVNENRDLLDRLSNLTEKVEQSRASNSNKSIYSSEDDFYINTNFATYLENTQTGYHSYTFPVFRTEQVDGVENVLLSLQEDGSYKAFLIVYALNAQERLDLENELNVDLTGKTTVYSLEDDSFVDEIFGKVLAPGDCVGILMCPYGGNDHPAGQACIDADRGDLYLDDSVCDDNAPGGDSSGGGSSPDGTSPGGDPGSGTTGTGTTGGGQTNNGGSGGFGQSNSTIITIPQPWEEVVQCLGLLSIDSTPNGFTSEMADWLQVQPKNVAGAINALLQNDDCSEESQGFAVKAIDVLMNGGSVDFDEKVIFHTTFTNSITKCIHDKMKSNTNNIYSKMLNHFYSSTQKSITFKINNSIGVDWGFTNGNSQILNDYDIIIHQDTIETNGSNLMRYVTLCHELIHAFMFDALEDVGVLSFDSVGAPVLNVNCPTNNINLNTQTIKDRFVSLICAMDSAGTLTQDWSHELFNSSVFDIQDYRQKLEELILNDYDWNSESSQFVNTASSTFGTNWKQEIAKAISWIGLEGTDGYGAYLSSYSNQISKLLYVSNIKNKISNTNNSCP